MNPHLIEDNEYDYMTYIMKKKKKLRQTAGGFDTDNHLTPKGRIIIGPTKIKAKHFHKATNPQLMIISLTSFYNMECKTTRTIH